MLFVSIAAPLFAQAAPTQEPNCPSCKSVPATGTSFVEEFEKLQHETLTEILGIADAVPEQKYAWKMSKTSPSVLDALKKIAAESYRTARLLRQPATTLPPVTTKKQAQEQVRAAFQAISRGVAAFPPGTDPAKIQVDLREVQMTMREYMIRQLSSSSQLLGELKVWAQVASEHKPAG